MSGKFSILLVEDNDTHRQYFAGKLRSWDYEVHEAATAKEGLQIARLRQPHVVVLDVTLADLPGTGGLTVCRALRNAPETRDIRVVMLSSTDHRESAFDAGADGYVRKNERRADALLKSMVGAQLRHLHSPNGIQFSLGVESGRPISIRASGAVQIATRGDHVFHANIERLAAGADRAVYGEGDRGAANQIGHDLWQNVFADSTLALYSLARGWMQGRPENLHLRFETAAADVKTPFEFLRTDAWQPAQLVLTHPLARFVTGVIGSRPPELPDDFSALLIASDTGGIPDTDAEVLSAATALENALRERGVSEPRIKTVLTKAACLGYVRELLDACAYDVVHYAGHGEYRADSPDESCLWFWEQTGTGRTLVPLKVTQLHEYLRRSQVRLMYLSACLGGRTAGQRALIASDFLGLSDGLLQSGVPWVLGFRAQVGDNSARQLATAFYRHLPRDREIDTALWRARCDLYAQEPTDLTWLSPILIAQTTN
ncbi:MAG: CHAT domain-containing protein [Bryobacterales bacterium]|nr:CHAT domain-containing protein [Bryobacterales bacterium]